MDINGKRAVNLLGVVLGGMYVLVGIQHFTNTAWFEPIVPKVLGHPAFWVLITGAMEVAIGMSLIMSRTRRHGALSSMAFLVGVYWANLNMWLNDIPLNGQRYGHGWHVARLVAQLGMIALSYAVWRSTFPASSTDESEADGSSIVVK